MELALLSIGGIYFLARILAIVFSRYKIPDVLLLMILGVLIGPVFGLISADSFGKFGRVLTTLALVIILFESGISMRLKQIKEAAGSTLKITLSTSIATMLLGGVLAVYLTSHFIGLSFTVSEGLLFGAIISGTSSAVVIPMVKSLKVSQLLENLLILESAITDVLCIILSFALMSVVLNPQDLNIGKVVGSTLASFGFASLIGVVGGYGWVRLISSFPDLRKMFFSIVAFVVMIYGASEFLGFSGAIASLAFGLFLNNEEAFPRWKFLKSQEIHELNSSERVIYGELVFLLKTFFFIFLGLVMPFKSWAVHFVAFVICIALFAIRGLLVSRCLVPLEKREKNVAIMMIPKGLAAAVLASVPAQLGIANGTLIEDLVYAVVFQSILISSVGVSISEYLIARRSAS